jgi:hypothetical protein
MLLNIFAIYFVTGEEQYFNKSYIESIINNGIDDYCNNILFNDVCKEQLIVYGARVIFDDNNRRTDYYEYYIDYNDYCIILLTLKINNIEIVKDYVIIRKINEETNLENGPVEIDNDYFDWNVTVVVNVGKRIKYTDNISAAYKVNISTGKIEKLNYNSIRIYNED